MQKEKGLVSVIIPVYNTGMILKETIDSVLNQQYSQFEILLIDDGSTDGTLQQVILPDDKRIVKISQDNQGMARTRNNGLALAKGEFILFLDHDDVIEPDFISVRVEYLDTHPAIGFVGGPITTFPDNPKEYMSAADNVERQVLFFDQGYLTTPSSYIIRSSVLADYNIAMNEKLSSTADRFLLLQLAKVTKGATVDRGRLLYRISANGFSQVIKPSLIRDNELFYYEIKKKGLFPAADVQAFKSQYLWGLSIGYLKVRKYHLFLKYLFLSFISSPVKFIKIVLKKLVFKQ